MASDKKRKFLRKFIKANPLCSEEDLVAAATAAVNADILDANEEIDADAVVATGYTTSEKVVLILGQWVANGKVAKVGNTHSWV